MHHHQPQPRDYTTHQRSFMQRRHSLSQGPTSRSRSEAVVKGKGKASTDSAPVLTGPNFNGYPSRHNSKSYNNNNLSSSPTSPVVNRDSSNFSPVSDPFDPPNDMNIRSRSKLLQILFVIGLSPQSPIIARCSARNQLLDVLLSTLL